MEHKTSKSICDGAQAEAQTQTDSACDLPAPCPESVSPGAPPSNTAPANCIDGEITILRSGVDSLYLTFHGELKDDIEKNFVRLKLLAQSESYKDQAKAFIEFGEDRFQIQPKGAGKYRFVIRDGRFYIKVSSSDADQMPMCHVQISSELLTRCGLDESVKALKLIVYNMGLVKRTTVSRVDICCDFLTYRDLGLVSPTDWVTRTRFIDPHYDSCVYTGTTFGTRKRIRANLYDKLRESRLKKKFYFDGLWFMSGWDNDQTVWRLEFQFYRPALKDFNIDFLHEFKSKRNSLWAYATHEWLRLASPTEDQTRARWPTDSLWKGLQSVTFDDHDIEPMRREFSRNIPADYYLFIIGIAGIISFMAIHNIPDFREAANQFLIAAEDFHVWNPKNLGQTLNEYAYEKAAMKARKFNLPFGDSTSESAEAYRKVKGK